MQIFAIKTPLIKANDNLATILLHSLEKRILKPKDGDIIAVSSKAVATAQGRAVKLDNVSISKKAKTLAETFSLEPQFAELIIREAEEIYGGVEKAILTLKNGVLTVNAGIDHKNALVGYAALWPLNPQEFAETLRDDMRQKTGKDVGVLVVDSGVAPLRMGTRGIALAAAGFKPVRDCRGEKDLFQKPLSVTRHAVADDLAAAAHLLMGETDERTPFVLIRKAPVKLTKEKVSPEEMRVPVYEDVYTPLFDKTLSRQPRNRRLAEPSKLQPRSPSKTLR